MSSVRTLDDALTCQSNQQDASLTLRMCTLALSNPIDAPDMCTAVRPARVGPSAKASAAAPVAARPAPFSGHVREGLLWTRAQQASAVSSSPPVGCVGPRRPSRMATAVSLLTRVLGPPSTLAQWLADSSTESLEAAQGAQVARSAAAAPPAQLNTQPPVTLGVPAAAPRVVAGGAQPRRVGVVLDAQGKAAPVNIVTTCVVTRADPVAADGVHVGAVLATRCDLTSWPRRTSGTLFMDRTRTGLDLSRSVPPPTQRTRLLAAAPVAVSVYCGSSRASEPSQAQQRRRRRPQSEHVSQQPGAGGTRAGEHAAARPVHGNRSSGGGA